MKLLIRYKFMIGFLLIFTLSALSLHFFMGRLLYEHSEKIIKNDFKNLQNYSREYLKQFFLLNDLYGDIFHKSQGKLIVQELSRNYQCHVALYNTEGDFLHGASAETKEFITLNEKEDDLLQHSSREDLYAALNNRSAFTTNIIDHQYIVNFSYPLYINQQCYGIIRFTKDYSYLLLANKNILNALTIFSIILFAVIFIFSYSLSNKITKPITKLTKALKEVALGNYDINIHIKTGDEIEEMADSFDYMKEKIRNQIEAIQREKEKIVKLEKTRREFFNNVTHELKTPLTTISGYAQIIGEKNFQDGEFLMKAAKQIKSESDRLHELVLELIEVSKKNSSLQPKPFEVVDLKETLKTLCEGMELKANKYHMKICCHLENAKVMGRKNELKEVFINLLDNGIKYGNNHSSIHVTLSRERSFVTIEVINECKSIEEDLLEKAFDPFFRGQQQKHVERGSRGLGLYICKTIIEEHGGEIFIEHINQMIKIGVNLPLCS